MDERVPQLAHGGWEDSTPAPGELELVRRFLSPHDHAASDGTTLEPGPSAIAWWLRSTELTGGGVVISDADVTWAMEIRDALVDKVRQNMGAAPGADTDRRLNAAAAETGLRPRFDEPRLVPTVDGVRGAIGRLLGIAFLAELDGSWHRYRLCADPTCTTVFYDRSKNHSAKWCSMQTCGNRSKVRAFRQRHASTA